jgi:hypothetical protein
MNKITMNIRTGRINVRRASRFQAGSGVFTCRLCGHNTRFTGDNGDVELCPICYSLCELENLVGDGGVLSQDDCRHVQADIEILKARGGRTAYYDRLVGAATSTLRPTPADHGENSLESPDGGLLSNLPHDA